VDRHYADLHFALARAYRGERFVVRESADSAKSRSQDARVRSASEKLDLTMLRVSSTASTFAYATVDVERRSAD